MNKLQPLKPNEQNYVDNPTNDMIPVKPLTLEERAESENPSKMNKLQHSALIKPHTNDMTNACPKCGAVCVSRIGGGNEWRCGMCATQWNKFGFTTPLVK
jgi:tRNA(Ile2) C34 agmatinyltransferase TiaS